jgi:hypothetical protein
MESSSVWARWTMGSRGRRGVREGAGRLTGSYAPAMALLVFALVVGLLIEHDAVRIARRQPC